MGCIRSLFCVLALCCVMACVPFVARVGASSNSSDQPTISSSARTLLDVLRSNASLDIPSITDKLTPEAQDLLRDIDFDQLSESCADFLDAQAKRASNIVESVLPDSFFKAASELDFEPVLRALGRPTREQSTEYQLCSLVRGLKDPDSFVNRAVQSAVDWIKSFFPTKS